jgi:hypothetical protein
MNRETDVDIQGILAFARYLSWADLLARLYEDELTGETDTEDAADIRQQEWRRFGLVCYWYGSLHVVVEAWDQLGFSDPVIDKLLAHPKDFRALLRRYRNGVFHFQRSLLDRKVLDLLEQGAPHVWWVRALHAELVRFLADHLDRLAETDGQRAELREMIEGMLHWYPYREAPEMDSLERFLARARDTIARHPDDRSAERDELLRGVELCEEALQRGRLDWQTLRAQVLRQAGIE